MSGLLAFIGLLFAWAILAGMKNAHLDETGVPPPTRSALRAMRRRARKQGVSEAEYYAGWLDRKHKKAGYYYDPGTAVGRTPIVVHEPVPSGPSLPKRLRPAMHESFDFERLSMMAKGFGWTLRKQAFGLYYLTDKDGSAILNPYAQPDEISTDFSHRDVDDFLLTS
jgi:hypothetical protein